MLSLAYNVCIKKKKGGILRSRPVLLGSAERGVTTPAAEVRVALPV